jgi:ABC-type branched-subunit amino acid transport system ATPase component
MSISDTITVLQGGAVISEGPPEAVSADEEVQRAYLGGAEL